MNNLSIKDLDFGGNDEEEYLYLNKDIDFGDKVAVKGQIVYIKSHINNSEFFLIDNPDIKKLIKQCYRKIKISRLL